MKEYKETIQEIWKTQLQNLREEAPDEDEDEQEESDEEYFENFDKDIESLVLEEGAVPKRSKLAMLAKSRQDIEVFILS